MTAMGSDGACSAIPLPDGDLTGYSLERVNVFPGDPTLGASGTPEKSAGPGATADRPGNGPRLVLPLYKVRGFEIWVLGASASAYETESGPLEPNDLWP